MRLVCRVYISNGMVRESWLCNKCKNKEQEENDTNEMS